jgi:nitrogen-specific signal transduction histidine kinase
VLQPLLVSSHGNRYRVIAGRRRLAAALAAGLREVPCLVQHVDVEQAEQMALASNLPAARPRSSTPAATSTPDKPGITAELTNIVSALVSCAELLASPSTLTQAVAADLVRAEAARALDSLVAIRVLRDEMPISRAPVAIQTILDRLAAAAALERQIRGVALHIDASSDARATMVKADARLLVSALSALVSAASALVESTGRVASDNRPAIAIRLRCTRETDHIAFSVTQHVVELPAAWLARPFDIAWPIRNGASALTQLLAARKIAQNHGGAVDVTAAEGGTSFVLDVPVVAGA